MPTSHTEAENIDENPAANQEQAFDIDEALNKGGFMEFLATYPDAADVDMTDPNVIQERFETFNAKENTLKGEGLKNVKESFQQCLERDMGFHLDAADLKLIDEHIEKQAVENPEEFAKWNEKIAATQELPKTIKFLETKLSQLGNSADLQQRLEEQQQAKSDLEGAARYSGFFGKAALVSDVASWAGKAAPTWFKRAFGGEVTQAQIQSIEAEGRKISEQRGALKAVEAKYGKIDNTRSSMLLAETTRKIAKIEDAMTHVKNAEELRPIVMAAFEKNRKELLGGIAGLAEMTALLQTRAKERLEGLMGKKDMKSLNKAQQMLDAVQNSGRRSEIGVDVFAGIDQKAKQEELDKAIGEQALSDVEDALARLRLGDGALLRLEKSLESFLTSEKTGSVSGEEAREFIIETLQRSTETIEDTAEGDIKMLMIARIIGKLKKLDKYVVGEKKEAPKGSGASQVLIEGLMDKLKDLKDTDKDKEKKKEIEEMIRKLQGK